MTSAETNGSTERAENGDGRKQFRRSGRRRKWWGFAPVADGTGPVEGEEEVRWKELRRQAWEGLGGKSRIPGPTIYYRSRRYYVVLLYYFYLIQRYLLKSSGKIQAKTPHRK